MDNNLSGILDMVLSNPEMLGKVMDLMPVLLKSLNGEEKPPAVSPAAFETAAPNIPAAAPEMSAHEPAVIAAEDPGAAVSAAAIISEALGAAVSSGGSADSSAAAALDTAPLIANPLPETRTASPSSTAAPNPASLLGGFDIEKVLGVLKNTKSAAAPEKDHRIALLLALKPFLGNNRKSKVDMALKYMNAAKVFKMIGKNGLV